MSVNYQVHKSITLKNKINILFKKQKQKHTFLDMVVQGSQGNHIPKLQVSPLLYEDPVNKEIQLNN